jgi:hypothetical protein
LLVKGWIREEFGKRKIRVIKIAPKSGDKEMDKFWVGVYLLCFLSEGGETLTLKDMIIAFFGMVACGTSQVITGCPGMKRFACREQTEAEFEIKDAVGVASWEGLGERVPVDGLNGVISPTKSFTEVGLQKVETVYSRQEIVALWQREEAEGVGTSWDIQQVCV